MAFTGLPRWLASPLEDRLRDRGFAIQGKAARRTTNRKVDILSVELVRKSLCLKWRVPYGSLMVEPACFLPFVPSMETKVFRCCRQSLDQRLSYLDCQIRFSVRRRVRQPEVANSPNLWFADPESDGNQEIIDDIVRVLEEDSFPFFAKVEDLDRFLEHLQQGNDDTGSGRIWNIGRPGSFSRLMMTGFVALEAEQWSLAHETLGRCLEAIDSDRRLNISAEVRECISSSRLLALGHKHLPAC